MPAATIDEVKAARSVAEAAIFRAVRELEHFGVLVEGVDLTTVRVIGKPPETMAVRIKASIP